MDDSFGPILFVVVLVLVIAGIVASVISAKKRRETLAALAASMGFTFTPKGSKTGLQAMGSLPLFNKGHSRRTYNIMAGVAQGINVRIFDYRYTVGHGKNSHTYSQTAILFETETLNLPVFRLSPESVFHKIGSAFGMQDIDFDSHPEFSKRYLLKGENEAAIREIFTPGVLSFFEQHEKLSVEGDRHRLLVYRSSKKIKPELWQNFMTEGFGVFALFKG